MEAMAAGLPVIGKYQQPTGLSKQPIRARYLGHVIGYQSIRDQYSELPPLLISHYSSLLVWTDRVCE